MKQKLFIIAVLFSFTVAVFTRKIIADTGTVESDYARDVMAGEQELKTDSEAFQASKEVKEAEKAEAQIDQQEVIPERDIQPAEAVEPVEDLLPSGTEVLITPEPEPSTEPLPTEIPTETPP